MDTGDRDSEMEEVLAAFVRLQGANSKLSRALASNLGIGSTDLRALLLVARVHDITPRAIAEYLELSSGAITTLLDRLEREGYLHRQAHPSDRRSLRVVLKPRGAEAVSAVYATYRSAFEAAIGEAQVSSVERFLTSLAGALGDVSLLDTAPPTKPGE